jgi:hemerythrin-like metal-binding protein
MAQIEWSPTWELGVGAMDETHREFVRHLDMLALADDAQMLERYDALYLHTVEHFGQEDEWMQSIRFPLAHCHSAEHDGVLEAMREARGHIESGKYEVGRVLARELAAWFGDHAATMDALLAQVLKASGTQLRRRAA